MNKTKTAISIPFYDYKLVEPEELIVLSEDYLNILPSIKDYLARNKSRLVTLPFTRISSAGKPEYKNLTGHIGEVSDDRFTFRTYKDFSSVYDYLHELVVRFDSVLGIIPYHSADLA